MQKAAVSLALGEHLTRTAEENSTHAALHHMACLPQKTEPGTEASMGAQIYEGIF